MVHGTFLNKARPASKEYTISLPKPRHVGLVPKIVRMCSTLVQAPLARMRNLRADRLEEQDTSTSESQRTPADAPVHRTAGHE